MKKLIYSLIFTIVSLTQQASAAADLKYFEFSPDTPNAVNVAAFSAIYQDFKPYNDFLNGADIWVDNAGSEGTASFTLLNQNGSAVVLKTITIPNIPAVWGGKKIHISFNPAQVSSTSTYKIKISSSLPKFRMYYLSKIDVLSHNAPFNYSNLIGSAYLGSAMQDFIFKFSLYENGDILAPKVANLAFNAISDNQMRVDINANEPVGLKIDYQATEINDVRSISHSGSYNLCIEGENKCSLILDVFPNRIYNYQLYVFDFWGNQTLIAGAFESSKTGDFEIFTPFATSTEVTVPALSIVNPRIALLTPYSAKIAWSTNIPAVSRGLVSLDQEWSQIITRMGDNTFEFEHLLDTGNVLSPNTHYYALINSDSLSTALTGEIISFITLPAPPPDQKPTTDNQQTNSQLNNQQNQQQNIQPSSQIQSSEQFVDASESLPILTIGVMGTGGGGTATAVIKWEKPASGVPSGGYRIDIFDSNNNLIKQITVSAGDDRISIEGLLPGEYRAVVYADNNQVFEKVGKETKFSVVSKKSIWEKLGLGIFKFALAGFGFLIFGTALILKIIKKRRLKNGEPI